MDKNNRRNFIGNIAKAGLIGFLPYNQLEELMNKPASASTAANDLFVTRPYLQNLGFDTCTIMWITAKPCASWVEYGTDRPEQKAVHSDLGLVDAGNYINRITLTGLKPATKYAYRVCSHEIVDFQPYKMTFGENQQSDIFYFTTPDLKADSISWVIFNDIHDRPASFPLLYSLIKDFKHEFVFLNGDMFDYETNQQQLVDHLLNPLGNLFSTTIPFMFARGNHETRGVFARNHADYFENPDNQYHFSFTRGPVHFVVLDTGEDKEDNHEAYNGLVAFDAYREEQAKWLAKEIETPAFKKAPFRVVMMHIPPFESGDWHGPMHCREMFNGLFNKGKIDLLVCGHTHRYGVHQANDAHQYPLIIGGGPLETKRTIMKVTANKQNLELTMLRDDGTTVGELKLKSRR